MAAENIQPPADSPMETSDLKYARSGDLNIAYQQYGSGPDVVIIPGLVCNVELAWEHEVYRRAREHIGKYVRVFVDSCAKVVARMSCSARPSARTQVQSFGYIPRGMLENAPGRCPPKKGVEVAGASVG